MPGETFHDPRIEVFARIGLNSRHRVLVRPSVLVGPLASQRIGPFYETRNEASKGEQENFLLGQKGEFVGGPPFEEGDFYHANKIAEGVNGLDEHLRRSPETFGRVLRTPEADTGSSAFRHIATLPG